MRIIVTLHTEQLRLPLACNHLLQGLLYHIVGADPHYGEFLHDTGFNAGNKRFKLFVFRPLYGTHAVEGKQILFPDGASLELRSPDAAFIQAFFAACRPGMHFSLNGQPVTVTNCRLENAPLLQDGVRVRTLSPITVHTTDAARHTTYYAPPDAAFYDLIDRNARRKWNSFYGDAPFDFSVEAAQDASFRRVVTTFKGVYITAWHGEFFLHGSPHALDFLYHTGLGARSSQGFGMFAPLPEKA